MTLLVEDLLDLSRLDAGVVAAGRDGDRARAAAGRLPRALRSRRPLGGGALWSASARPGLRGRCDPLQLGRVLSNLVGNAIRHTPPGGRVLIEARDGVEVSVSDTGEGLPAGADERVFERFWRGDESRGAGGTGLGLAIARAIVELHGGTIRVGRRRPAAARCFTFTLPA